jgi:hypothetical protein
MDKEFPYEEETEEESEWEEWRKDDNARRYREWESDNRSPY